MFSIAWLRTRKFRPALLAGVAACTLVAAGANAAKSGDPRPFLVYDSTGVLVGSLLDRNVLMTVRSARVAVRLFPVPDSIGKFEYEVAPAVYYEELQCQGAPYAGFASADVPTGVVLPGTRVLVLRTTGAVAPVATRSLLRQDGTCVDQDGFGPRAQLTEPVDITNRYKLPFHVK